MSEKTNDQSVEKDCEYRNLNFRLPKNLYERFRDVCDRDLRMKVDVLRPIAEKVTKGVSVPQIPESYIRQHPKNDAMEYFSVHPLLHTALIDSCNRNNVNRSEAIRRHLYWFIVNLEKELDMRDEIEEAFGPLDKSEKE